METYNKPKAAAFVDISNIFYGARYAKWRISYKKIQEHLENKYELTFFCLYGCEDNNPSNETFKERAIKQQGFYNKLASLGISVFKKPLQYIDGKIDGDVDGDIKNAVHKFINDKKIEYIILFSGDKHFLPVIKECCSADKRIQVYSFRQVLSDKIKNFVLQNGNKCNFIYLNKKRSELEHK